MLLIVRWWRVELNWGCQAFQYLIVTHRGAIGGVSLFWLSYFLISRDVFIEGCATIDTRHFIPLTGLQRLGHVIVTIVAISFLFQLEDALLVRAASFSINYLGLLCPCPLSTVRFGRCRFNLLRLLLVRAVNRSVMIRLGHDSGCISSGVSLGAGRLMSIEVDCGVVLLGLCFDLGIIWLGLHGLCVESVSSQWLIGAELAARPSQMANHIADNCFLRWLLLGCFMLLLLARNFTFLAFLVRLVIVTHLEKRF